MFYSLYFGGCGSKMQLLGVRWRQILTERRRICDEIMFIFMKLSFVIIIVYKTSQDNKVKILIWHKVNTQLLLWKAI